MDGCTLYLQIRTPPVSLKAMESHEWNETTDGEKRFYRGNFHANEWRILTKTKRRDVEWDRIEEPSEKIWRSLRGIVWKKYQRKRCPWERVASLDKILGDETEKP